MVSLGVAPPFSSATAVSSDGSVIAGVLIGRGGFEAFRWTQASGPLSLGFMPGGSTSEPRGVSGDGSVIVGRGDTSFGGNLAFPWTQNDGMIFLGDLPGSTLLSLANGVSADGSVIVGSSVSGKVRSPEAFRWTQVG